MIIRPLIADFSSQSERKSNFRLEFCLPYLILRNKDWNNNSFNPHVHSFWACVPDSEHVARSNEREQQCAQVVYELYAGFVVTGYDHDDWTVLELSSRDQSQQNDKESTLPGLPEGDWDGPEDLFEDCHDAETLLDPRLFYLRAVEQQLRLAVYHYGHLIRSLEVKVESLVS